MNLINLTSALAVSGVVGLSPIKGPQSAHTNALTYAFATVNTNWHRTTDNTLGVLPFSLQLDFSSDSVYDNVNYRFADLPGTFRANWSGIEIALINTSGTYRTSRYSANLNFVLASDLGGPYLEIASTFYDTNVSSNGTAIKYYYPEQQFHTMVIDMPFLHPNLESKINFRWGNYTAQITCPFTAGEWATTDSADTTTFNTGFRMFRSGSAMAVSTWTSATEYTQFKYTDLNSVDDAYYTNLANWYYEKGMHDSDSNALLRFFSATIGILINFVLMVLNLQVFNISLMSIFSILVAFVGIVWILKLIRG